MGDFQHLILRDNCRLFHAFYTISIFSYFRHTFRPLKFCIGNCICLNVLQSTLYLPQGIKVKYITRVNNSLSTYPSFGSRRCIEVQPHSYTHTPLMGYLSIPGCLPGLYPVPLPCILSGFPESLIELIYILVRERETLGE